jgi:hypothetical protein
MTPQPEETPEQNPTGVCRMFLCDKPREDDDNANCADHQNIAAVCSRSPRPSVQNNYSPKGNQHWSKDTFHAAKDTQKTYCGKNRTDWLIIDAKMPRSQAMDDFHFCSRCRAALDNLVKP